MLNYTPVSAISVTSFLKLEVSTYFWPYFMNVHLYKLNGSLIPRQLSTAFHLNTPPPIKCYIHPQLSRREKQKVLQHPRTTVKSLLCISATVCTFVYICTCEARRPLTYFAQNRSSHRVGDPWCAPLSPAHRTGLCHSGHKQHHQHHGGHQTLQTHTFTGNQRHH